MAVFVGHFAEDRNMYLSAEEDWFHASLPEVWQANQCQEVQAAPRKVRL
jgi:hypothetical protein